MQSTEGDALLENLLFPESTVSKSVAQPTSDQILGHIDAEIARIQTLQTLGGWNAWVLIGVGVALAALLVPILEKPGLDVTKTIFWFISLSLLIDGILSWFIPGGGGLDKLQTEIRTRSGIFFRRRRPLFVAVLIRYLLLIVAAFATGQSLDAIDPGLIFVCVPAFYIVRSFEPIGLLLASTRNQLWPDRSGRGEGIRIFQVFRMTDRFGIILMTYLPLVLTIAYAHAAGLPMLGQPVPDSLRAGFLIAVLSFLVLWVLDTAYKPPIVEGLLGIRRQLAFSQISTNQAMVQVEVVLGGDLPLPEVDSILVI